ncbi:MAG: ankyrin repeat domain-containing protein, partial [Gemmatimonadota bacterium]|nr:ankyrin repeat domain-containing protein [Gemmatimonadota bacterium]
MKNTPVRLASILGLSLVLAAATPFESPVADAAQAADADRVRTLLQQGADANAAQADGLTAMHWAALNDDKEILDLLMYAGANLKPLTRVGGYTPLHLAARSGHPMIVAALLEAGADANR